MKEKIKIIIQKEDLPKPRIPIWKIKPEKIHQTSKHYTKKIRREGRHKLKKLLKGEISETD